MMINVCIERGYAMIQPVGHYAQTEFAEGLDRALAACPDGCAAGLIMDFRQSSGVERHSVVRVRETTRYLVARADRYRRHIAVIVPNDGVSRIMEIGGAISHQQGITYGYCHDVDEAIGWLTVEVARMEAAYSPNQYQGE